MENIKDLKTIIEKKVSLSNQVFIVPHKNADFDAIASAIGMSMIVKKIGKPVYIILEEDPAKIESGVKNIVEEINDFISIIDIKKYNELKSNHDLLITVDVNKRNLICCSDYLKDFSDIILVDHHNEDENTIRTNYKYINSKVSSVSEILVELLCLFRVKYSANIANYLLAGIYLDTNKYTKNCPAKTMSIVSKLLDKGADINKVNEFFEEDFISDRKVQNLVNKANFFTYSIAVCIADDTVKYTKEELAKVADYLLRYKADATFAAGFIDDELISISARSKGKIDVSKIMKEFGGGGNVYSAASKIEKNSLCDTELKLIKNIKPLFYLEENN